MGLESSAERRSAISNLRLDRPRIRGAAQSDHWRQVSTLSACYALKSPSSVGWHAHRLSAVSVLPAIIALLIAACEAPREPADTTDQSNTEEDADFNRMVTAGKMLSDLHTYLASGDAAPHPFTFDRLAFAPGSSLIQPVDQPTIHTLAATLHNNPDVRARIVGFGDGDRSKTDNNALGLQRAMALRLALTKAGIHPSRLETAAGREANGQRPAQLIILQK